MKLKEYLQNQKIIYRSFAKDLKISVSYLKNILAGDRRPGLMLSLRIEELTNGQITSKQLAEDFKTAKEKLKSETLSKHNRKKTISPDC
jgi:transcriptional regulator with XRE-family HTH domain